MAIVEPPAPGMRWETVSEHIARDMDEGRFPGQSELKQVPDTDASEAFAAWLNQGPKLAAAAGCHVGITVTEAPQKAERDQLREVLRKAAASDKPLSELEPDIRGWLRDAAISNSERTDG